jgi:hypothetical protein
LAPLNPAIAQKRELGAHEHGRGTLNIAVEGRRLSLELEAPGADIVGFEHSAKTPKDKAAVAAAKKRLSAPLELFKLPASAGCAVKEATVEIESEGHGHAAGAKGKSEGGHKHAPKDEPEHSQFHAQYVLDCKTPAEIRTIELGYFGAFAGARRLDVNLITPKGQSKFEATRASPRIDLAGMM